jgi:lipoprotein signal peptidase
MITPPVPPKITHRLSQWSSKYFGFQIPLLIFLLLLLADIITKLIFENLYAQHIFYEVFPGFLIGHEDHFKHIPATHLVVIPIALLISILTYRKFLWVSVGFAIKAASIGNVVSCNTRNFSTDWIMYKNQEGTFNIINLADLYLWNDDRVIITAIILYFLRFIMRKLKDIFRRKPTNMEIHVKTT